MKQEIYYSIKVGNQYNIFGIDRQLGLVFLNENFDRELVLIYLLIIKVLDNGNFFKINILVVFVEVRDVNDQRSVFQFIMYFKELFENIVYLNLFLQVYVIDDDEGVNVEIQYIIIFGNDQGLFIVYGRIGVVFIIFNVILDYEIII